MYKTKVVTEEVKYECCDICGDEITRNSNTYRTYCYIAHYSCVDALLEKNVTKEARQAAEKKASEEKDYRGTYVGELRHLAKV